MKNHLSRRRFLSTTSKSAVAAITVASLTSYVREIIATSIETPQTNGGANGDLKPVFKKLDEYIARHMVEVGAPGMTLALANREGPLRISTYGFADTKTNTRVTPDTLFQIGSISKSFVGLTLLQQREEGKLDLNKPIVELLPWLKINSKFDSITTHHLLSHTSGLPGAPLLLDALLAELWTTYAPGNRFLYSNTGYNILGFIVEAVEKRPFADTLRDRLLKRLGMDASFPMITNDLRSRTAVGYGPVASDRPYAQRGPLAESSWIEMDMAAGSVISTPGDMAKYIRMLLNRGALPQGRLISEETFNLFVKPQVKSPFRGEDASYGYGLWTSEMNGHTRLRHTGGMVAFSSSIDVDLTAGVGGFASVNASLRGGYRPVAVTRYAVDLLNAALAGKPLPDAPVPPPDASEIKNASDYAGTYSSSEGEKLILAAEGSGLFLVHGSQRIPLERSGGDLFLIKHPDFALFPLGFTRENQKVTEAYHGAKWYMGESYTGPKTFSYAKEWDGYVGHYANDSPWYGDIRIVLRKGQLYQGGVQRLVARPDGKFHFGDPELPDYMTFDSIINGRAMRLNFSEIVFRRTFTP